jgi:hypothetical protein
MTKGGPSNRDSAWFRASVRKVLIASRSRTKRWWRFPLRRVPKVFFIGFNKTGTTSLASLTAELGLRTCHRTDWAVITDMNDPLLAEFEVFSDGERSSFVDLDRAFPGSKFVLNTRELLPWLTSRVKWVTYRQNTEKFGEMRAEFETLGLERAVLDWADRRDSYHQAVLEYFVNRPEDFMVVNAVTDTRAGSKIVRFLRANPIFEPELPHRNSSQAATPIELQEQIKACLLRVGVSEAALMSETVTDRVRR